ncbi:MAG: hypothetical protein ABIS68_09215 [Casimicrobiaceae bacterium]
MLRQAIDGRLDFAFESTLGGETITAMLLDAARGGVSVHIWLAGLATVEMHIERVRRRVAKGGHDIPAEKIRERFEQSRINLIRLLPPVLDGLRL